VAGDEVVFGKAGKETYGIGRFFSSLQNRVIPGLSFFVFSLIHVKERQSFPIQAVQMVKEQEDSKKCFHQERVEYYELQSPNALGIFIGRQSRNG
jgi:hypothetical protein